MSTSKLQRLTSEKLSTFFGKFTIRENTRPEWLLTSNGQRLELDFYIEELDTAIEVQGAQHYKYTPHFHGDHEGFKSQIERDRAKKRICDNVGIELHEIASELDLDILIRELYEEVYQCNPEQSVPDALRKVQHDRLQEERIKKLHGAIARALKKEDKKAYRSLLARVKQIVEVFGIDELFAIGNESAGTIIQFSRVYDGKGYNKKRLKKTRIRANKLRIEKISHTEFIVTGGAEPHRIEIDGTGGVICDCRGFLDDKNICSHIWRYYKTYKKNSLDEIRYSEPKE